MTYTPISTPGAKMYISATPTGSATLEILGIESIDRVGSKSDGQERTTMRDTAKRKGKSVLEDAGSVSISGLWSNQDAGQQMLTTARAASQSYNFKVVLNDAAQLGLTNNTTFTFAALVMSFDLQPGRTPGEDLKFTATIDVDGAVSETLPS